MPSETIEGAWDFTAYISLGALTLLLLAPTVQHLYSTCELEQYKTILTSISKISGELEEGMTVKLSLSSTFGVRLSLTTSGTRITLHAKDRSIDEHANVTFYDTSIELYRQLSISKINGKILVESG